ncbi:MAG TPA: S26 family signal peptidase [Euzebyales bacterium]|nr:S26 family signal peptidase [Euzebyales bacterium]
MIWAVGATIVAGVAVVMARRRYVVVTVGGPSMRPTYDHGDQVLVRRVAAATLRRGQVVVVRGPYSDDVTHKLKRIVAGPGDPVPEAAAAACGRPAGAPVPAGRLVVYGDAPNSYDSRAWGFLSAGDVLGVAVRRLAPSPARPVAGR